MKLNKLSIVLLLLLFILGSGLNKIYTYLSKILKNVK